MRLKLFGGIGPITRRGVLRNALAGVMMASMSIPQVLGYTRIAGTTVVSGLYTVFLPLEMFAIFGSSLHLVVAADSATAAIFASGLSGMAPRASEAYMTLTGMVALLTAALLLLARIFRLGFLADFLSRTVLVGFLTGVGCQICIAMLGDMLGIAVHSERSVVQLWQVAQGLSQTHLPSAALSALVVSVILVCGGFLPRLPATLLVVAGGIAASFAWDFAGHGIAVIGPVRGGLPSFHFPSVGWEELLKLIPIAVSCSVIIIAKSSAVSRAYALRHHERVDVDADILGLSAANAAAALSGAFVVNGSTTQTAMAERAGATSQLTQMVVGGVVLLVLLFLTGPLQYLPLSMLAGIVFTIAVGLINVKGLRDIRRVNPGEFWLAAITAAAVVLLAIEHGVLLAVAVSLLLHVRHSYRPNTRLLATDETGNWLRLPAQPGAETAPGLVVYRFGAALFYANETRFADEVRALVEAAPHPVSWFVIEAGAITDLDYSAACSLRELCDDLTRRGVGLVFAQVSPFLRADMDQHGLTAVIGEKHLVPTLHQALVLVHSGLSDPRIAE